MKMSDKTFIGQYQNCSKKPEKAENAAQNMFRRITSKWGVQTLVLLIEGELRFSQLKKHLIKITDRMLIKTLHELEDDGLICRKASETDRKKVFYSLSPEGHELAALLHPLTEWLQEYAISALSAASGKHYTAGKVE